jgi:Holliday junction resolvase YEN1
MAISLAREGYGTTLLDGINRNQSSTDLAAFLAIWRETIIYELQTNQSGFLHKCLPALAASVPLDFPDLKLINLYLDPLTSERERPKETVTTIAEQGPDLVRLARFIEEHFVWGDLTGILKRFSTCVFPGLALRQLLSAACDIDRGLQPKPLSMIGKTHGQRQPSKASSDRALEVRATLVISRRTIDAIRDGLAGKRDTPMTSAIVGKWIENTLPRLRVWIPAAIHSFFLSIQAPLVVEDEPGML